MSGYANRFRVEITELENGFTVEVPDMVERKKRVAEAAKKDAGKSTDCCYAPYLGDCTKSFAAKSVAEVLKLVRESLEQIPENEFTAAFAEQGVKRK